MVKTPDILNLTFCAIALMRSFKLPSSSGVSLLKRGKIKTGKSNVPKATRKDHGPKNGNLYQRADDPESSLIPRVTNAFLVFFQGNLVSKIAWHFLLMPPDKI